MLICELMETAKSSETMKQWIPIVEEYFKKLSKEDYDCLYDEIYETIYGEVLSKEKAEYLVHEMKPYGQKWTMNEVDQVLGGNCKLATRYYTMNMMFNDYHDLFNDDTEKYVEISKLWLNDVDSEGGDIKTYRYATRV